MKHDGHISLNAQLLLVQLSSLCLALAVFFCGLLVGRSLLNDVYLSDEACLKRELRYIQSLNAYVREHELRSTDSEALRDWARGKKYVHLSVYQGKHPILETDGYDLDVVDGRRYSGVSNSVEDDSLLLPDEDGYYRLQFADGIFRVSITEFSETLYYDLSVMAALALACMALLAVNLHHNSRVTRAIVRLSQEVQRVEQDGDAAEIRSNRKDEIGELARSVERMRRAIIQQMQNEQDAWQANSGLITAISHDIRTPLTALIGYLDLLEGRQYENEEQMERYISAGRDRAQQLKVLTDELFRYFLVFGQKEMQLRMEEYDAVILLEQLLGDQVIQLREKGFTVQSITLQEPCRVRLDVQYFQRVLDNLFVNIQKHGDPTGRVTIMSRKEGNTLKLDLLNSVPQKPTNAESTRIGLQTCRKILRQMGGDFETQQEARRFLAEITLPLCSDSPEEPEESQPVSPAPLPPRESSA